MSFCTLQATKPTTCMKLILFHSLLSRPGSEVINTSYETVCRACSRVCIRIVPKKKPNPKPTKLESEKTTLFQEQSMSGTEYTALSHYTLHLRWEFKSRSSLAQVSHMCLVWKPIKHIAEMWILKQVVLLFTVSSGDSISPYQLRNSQVFAMAVSEKGGTSRVHTAHYSYFVLLYFTHAFVTQKTNETSTRITPCL